MAVRKQIGAEAYDIHALRYAAAGDALGVSVDTLSRIEGGKMGDPIPPLYALAIQMLAQIKATA